MQGLLRREERRGSLPDLKLIIITLRFVAHLKSVAPAVMLTAVAALSACSKTPSESAVEKLFKGERAVPEYIAIKNFSKTDGRLDDAAGRYTCSVEYDLVFLKSSDDLMKGLAEDLEVSANARESGAALAGMFGQLQAGISIFALKMQYGDFEAGHTVHKTEALTLERWESGWKFAEK